MPYKSLAQKRLFHAKARRGEMSMATVRHWDRETAGKALPRQKGR